MNAVNSGQEKKLTLKQILTWLEEDGIISPEDYQNCENSGLGKLSKHPLNIVATCEIQNQTQLGKVMTLEQLTQWLAKKVEGMIPLRIGAVEKLSQE